MIRPPRGGCSWAVEGIGPLKNIRNQLKMSVRTLKGILAFAKAHPLDPIIPRKPVYLLIQYLFTI